VEKVGGALPPTRARSINPERSRSVPSVSGPRHELWQDHRGRSNEPGAVTRSGAAPRRPAWPGYLVYFALGAAALTFLITRDVRSTISVVIVAGACGIAAGTPLAILGGIGRAARLGRHQSRAGSISRAWAGSIRSFSTKTGTPHLQGHPEVQTIRTGPRRLSPEAVLEAAASAENAIRSTRSGQAIVTYARAQGPHHPRAGAGSINTPGRGHYRGGRRRDDPGWQTVRL